MHIIYAFEKHITGNTGGNEGATFHNLFVQSNQGFFFFACFFIIKNVNCLKNWTNK